MNQAEQILKHLKSGKSLTPLEALRKFNCLRLGARVYDLHKEGHRIDSELVETKSGKHVVQYTIGK